MAIFELSASNILTFTNVITSNIKWKAIRHRLRMTSSVKVNSSFQEVPNKLWFQHVATVTKSLQVTVGNVLNFNQKTIPKSIDLVAASGLPIAHEARVYKNKPGINILEFFQEAEYILSKYNALDTLVLTQAVDFKKVKLFTINHFLRLDDYSAVYKPNKNFVINPIDVTPVQKSRLIFGAIDFELRNANLGNSDSLEFTRLSRNTTGGDVIIFRDNRWPEIEKLSITFDNCSPNIMQKIRDLIKVSLGKPVTYIDYNGITWSALITNPNTAIRQAGINTYTVALELEAEEV